MSQFLIKNTLDIAQKEEEQEIYNANWSMSIKWFVSYGRERRSFGGVGYIYVLLMALSGRAGRLLD